MTDLGALQALKDKYDELSQLNYSDADVVPAIAYELGRMDGLLDAISVLETGIKTEGKCIRNRLEILARLHDAEETLAYWQGKASAGSYDSVVRSLVASAEAEVQLLQWVLDIPTVIAPADRDRWERKVQCNQSHLKVNE